MKQQNKPLGIALMLGSVLLFLIFYLWLTSATGMAANASYILGLSLLILAPVFGIGAFLMRR